MPGSLRAWVFWLKASFGKNCIFTLFLLIQNKQQCFRQLLVSYVYFNSYDSNFIWYEQFFSLNVSSKVCGRWGKLHLAIIWKLIFILLEGTRQGKKHTIPCLQCSLPIVFSSFVEMQFIDYFIVWDGITMPRHREKHIENVHFPKMSQSALFIL